MVKIFTRIIYATYIILKIRTNIYYIKYNIDNIRPGEYKLHGQNGKFIWQVNENFGDTMMQNT
jgi:hypothetical protein